MKDLSKDMLSAYIDNEVSGKPCEMIKSHIENCVECRKRLDFYSNLKTKIGESKIECDYSAKFSNIKNFVVSYCESKKQPKYFVNKFFYLRLAFSFLLLLIFIFTFIILSARLTVKGGDNTLVKNSKTSDEVKVVEPDYSKIKSVDY